MQGDFDAFSRESPTAKRVELAGRIVLHRDHLSVRDAAEIWEAGRYCPASSPVCELEVGGQVLARGEIVEEEGCTMFRVDEVLDVGLDGEGHESRTTARLRGEEKSKEEG